MTAAARWPFCPYTPEARLIYNLPGRFYPKGMKINVAGGEVPVEKLGNRWDLHPP